MKYMYKHSNYFMINRSHVITCIVYECFNYAIEMQHNAMKLEIEFYLIYMYIRYIFDRILTNVTYAA